MKVLILGATGKLGCYTALHLASAGHQVVAAGRRTTDNGFFSENGCEFVGGVELERPDSFGRLPSDIGAVVHLAGAMPGNAGCEPFQFVRSIVEGCLNVLEWMRRGTCRRIVFNTTPSDVAHLLCAGKLVADDALRSFPHDGGDHAVYAICKNAAVDVLTHYSIAYNFKPCVFRHMTVYGWNPTRTFWVNGVPQLTAYQKIIRKCISGGPIEIWGDPYVKKELLYVKDFSRAVEMAIGSERSGVFNLPGVRPYSLMEQISGYEAAYAPGGKCEKILRPDKPTSPASRLSGEKALRELGWKAQWEWRDAVMDMKGEALRNRFVKLWGNVDPLDLPLN